jgi:spermidine synthase
MVKKKPAKKGSTPHKSSPSPLALNLLILFCFLLSGVAGLIYQVLWVRMIDKVIGSAPFAVATVLSVFMGGLALGSYLAGRYIDRVDSRRNLLSLYGKVEVAIGVYGLLLPALIYGATPLYALAYNYLFADFWAYQVFAFFGCTLLLIIPTSLMGATLPILCRFYVTHLDHLGTRTGRLYGINTVGAAIGTLLCGFMLIQTVGVWGTLIVAAGLNGLVGIACIMLGRASGPLAFRKLADKKGKGVSKDKLGDQPYKELESDGQLIPWALLIFAVSGFCGMAYEVIWARLLGLIIGPTTYSFTIVVATFIIGLAAGSFLFGWLGDRTKNVFGVLMATQLGAAVFALLVSQFLGNSQFFFAKLIHTFRGYFQEMILAQSLILFLVLLGPTLFLGASFPLVNRIYARSLPSLGRSIGTAYAINTLGAILGSFMAGFALIPFLGKENGLRFTVMLQFAVALAALLVWGTRRFAKARLVPLCAGVGLLGVFLFTSFPSWNRQSLSYGRYRAVKASQADRYAKTSWFDALWRGSQILGMDAQNSELLFYGDGIGGFTTVEKTINSLGAVELSLLNSGKPDASTHGDRFTQALLAHAPLLFHAQPEKVMVLGLASGMTAGEVLHYPVKQLDVLEISDQVIKASQFFTPWNNGCLSDPRSRIIVQDGRNHLALTREKYDVIISEPSNPWMAGLANLFTRDFFESVRERLRPNGIFVQWIHGYEMDWRTFAMVGRTFTEVFQHGLLMTAKPPDYLLVGFAGQKGFDLQTAERNIVHTKHSRNISLRDPRLLFHLIITEDPKKLFGPGPVHTDNWPQLEFAAPKQLYIDDPPIKMKGRGLTKKTTDFIASSSDADSLLDMVAFSASGNYPRFKLLGLEGLTPAQKDRYLGVVRKYCSEALVSGYKIFPDETLKAECAEMQSDRIRQHLAVSPEDTQASADLATALNTLGVAMASQGKVSEAFARFSEAARIRPDFADAYNNMGLTLAKQGKFQEAVEQYAEAMRIKPDFAEAHGNMGNALMGQWKLEEAAVHYRKALLIRPDYEPAKKNLRTALKALDEMKKDSRKPPSSSIR